MKLAVTILTLTLVSGLFGQSTKLSGVIYDPKGAVIVGAEVKVINAAGKLHIVKSNSEGSYSLELYPGLHSIDVSQRGFISLRIEEYLVVQSAFGKMNYDFVLFGSRNHEPCGYTGVDCLSKDEFVDKITIAPSPSVKKIKY
ncbi:MAG: carboxypeptidase-like regulatory domain-containing protein [Pyrinomonadaceae bacterium]